MSCTRPAGIWSMRRSPTNMSSTIMTGDIYWCTADVGWVTGHSYILYGPLANGATTLMFEGVPNYPDASPLLAGMRQASGEHLLHSPYSHSRPHGRRRRAGQSDRSVVSETLGLRRRADQSGGLALVP